MNLSPEELEAYFREAAERSPKFSSIIYEKDFWVCWTLAKLFGLPELSPHLTFKGGTSLSKVYNIIERFSEDVDVSIHRSYFGFRNDKDPEQISGRNERDRALTELTKASSEFIATHVLPELREQFGELKGAWDLTIDTEDPQTILFHYPTIQSKNHDSYIRQFVRIEFGARSDNWPQEIKNISPYIAEIFPEEFGKIAQVRINALSLKRIFWEKATILHAEHHRPENKDFPTRHSRHFYDLYCLAHHPEASEMATDIALMERVVQHKKVFFRSSWTSYETARIGTFKLLPKDSQIETLRSDYNAMQQMFFGEYPSLDNIINALRKLELKINDR